MLNGMVSQALIGACDENESLACHFEGLIDSCADRIWAKAEEVGGSQEYWRLTMGDLFRLLIRFRMHCRFQYTRSRLYVFLSPLLRFDEPFSVKVRRLTAKLCQSPDGNQAYSYVEPAIRHMRNESDFPPAEIE